MEGERSGLFFEIIRLTGELRPRFIFLENVPAITIRGLDRVCLELTKMGYDLRWTVISAASVGAPHMRERWFLLAHDNSAKLWNESNGITKCKDKTEFANDGAQKFMANSNSNGEQSGSKERNAEGNRIGNSGEELGHAKCERLERYREEPGEEEEPQSGNTSSSAFRSDWWAVEPSVGRVADGVSNRVDRIKCLGNAVVPLQAREAFKRLMGL